VPDVRAGCSLTDCAGMSDSASTRSVPFRAGRLPGEVTPADPAAEHPAIIIPGVVMVVDISEFQPNVNDVTYVRDFSQAAIIRAAYGASHDDKAWYGGDRRKQLHQAGIQYLGIYQYITAFEDVTAQAREFCRLIGTMEDGEDLYADIEEGSGNLQSRWQTWAAVVRGELGWSPSDYSGANFATAHGLAPVDWIASYGTSEPATPHRLWQFTDAFSIPGVGIADCSVFHGSIADLRATAFGGSQPVQPVTYLTTAQTEAIVAALPVLTPGITDAQLPHWYVRRVQSVLNDVYGASPRLAVDGVYGAASQAAVKTLIQQRYGLAQDGVVGKDTWTAIVTAAA